MSASKAVPTRELVPGDVVRYDYGYDVVVAVQPDPSPRAVTVRVVVDAHLSDGRVVRQAWWAGRDALQPVIR